MKDDQLRRAAEQLGQAIAAMLGLKNVLGINLTPRQGATPRSQCVARFLEVLLFLQELFSRRQLVLIRNYASHAIVTVGCMRTGRVYTVCYGNLPGPRYQ